MKKILLVLTASAAFASCNNTQVDVKAEGEKVMQASRDWAKTVTTKDIDKITGYWADDALVIQPGQALLKGKKDIRTMVEESFKTPGFSITWEPQTVEVSATGDLAYLVEKSTINVNDSTGKPMTMHFNGVTIWKKQADGSWKNVVDIMTDDKK